MTSNEECFPRGGIKITSTDKPSNAYFKHENLFGNFQSENKLKKSKPKKRKIQSVGTSEEENPLEKELIASANNSAILSADTLSYKKIQEGLTVLACVHSTHVMVVKVELPGRCFGQILVQNISNAYTKVVKEAVDDESDDLPLLSDLLPPGTFLPVKVINIENEDNVKIICSCNPRDINSHLKHNHFTGDMLIWGAISEKSDHGYTVDVGVKNVRAHLPFANVEENVVYNVGQVLYMVVKTSINSQEATTLTLSALKNDINSNVESPGTSLDHVIPGMQVKLLVRNILKDGLYGQYFDDCTGFINELYLKELFGTSKQYKELSSIEARILYVHPMSRHAYLTLRRIDQPLPQVRHKNGDRFTSKIISKSGAGIIIKLQDGTKGFVTHNRLIKSLGKKAKENEDLATAISNKFPVGLQKHATILDYNHMENLYICTFENESTVYTVNDLQLAQTIKGHIKEINNHGMVIKIGKLDGFIPNYNISNVAYSDNIKNKFKVGQEVKTKVWNLDLNTNNLILTIKPDMIANNEHLTSYENINHKSNYPGVVITVSEKGVLLLFYGNVRGFLPKHNIPQLAGKSPRKEFYIGQILRVYVVSASKERMTLSLVPKVNKYKRKAKTLLNTEAVKIESEEKSLLSGEVNHVQIEPIEKPLLVETAKKRKFSDDIETEVPVTKTKSTKSRKAKQKLKNKAPAYNAVKKQSLLTKKKRKNMSKS